VTAEYDAVVYDLDGTLVRLPVDWGAARDDAAPILRSRGVDTTDMGLWDILEAARPNGVLAEISDVIASHERRGAESATRLPLADDLPLSVPVAICSLNCEAACHIALERHELDGWVGAVVGRDSVDTYKPDPAPLLAAVSAIDADPERSLFVGDSDRDREAADRAGLDFQWVEDRLADRAT
jgi:phosphoglycolate phosphatase